MPLGARLVVRRALRKGEAMMQARIYLEFAGCAGALKEVAQLIDHRQGRQLIVLGARDIDLTLDLAEIEVRAFDRVADNSCAIE